MTENKKIVLNVGCGPNNPAGLNPFFDRETWKEVRLDIDPNVNPDILADITNMPAVASESMDGLWSSHNIEHLYAHQVYQALKEFLRVLKPGGVALITTPDLQAVAQYVAEGKLEEPYYTSPAGPISPIDTIYGLRTAVAAGNVFMAHKTGFTLQSLAQKMEQVGFKDIKGKSEQLNLWIMASK